MTKHSSDTHARPASALTILAAFGVAVLALAFAGLAPTGAQTSPSAQNESSRASVAPRPRRVLVTPADIAGLPPGKKYLVKVGTGTLTLSGANAQSGKNNNGGGSGGSGLTKVGTGTLQVYEFRSIDFSRVEVQTGEDEATEGLETWLRRHRPADAMTGWPFKRLVIGPAEDIARVENWKAGTRPGAARYVCGNGSCSCSGTADCLKLADASKCRSAMTCTGEGSNVICYCTSD